MSDEKKEPRNYKREYANKKVYILSRDCQIIGTWGNLKKLCNDVRIENPDFPSYWTITRMPKDSPLSLTDKKGDKYVLNIEKVRR